MLNHCPICRREEFQTLLYQASVPTSQTPVSRGLEKECLGELRIVECENCTHIFNKAYDPELEKKIYTNDFAASLPTTPGYLKRYDEILTELLKDSDFKMETVLEIGSGDFTFSRKLLEKGAKTVCAFEPSDRFSTKEAGIVHIRDYFSSSRIPASLKKIDLVVLRHILEHVVDPRQMIRSIASVLKPGERLYIEVPNVQNILDQKRYYDFFYEHVSYFSVELLSELLAQEGFRLLRYREWAGGQHIGLLAELSETKAKAQYSRLIRAERKTQIQELQNHLAEFSDQVRAFFAHHQKCAIYGAGAHSITVLSSLDLGPDKVQCLFDLNPFKHEKLSPLSHIPIYRPSKERLQALDAVLIIAPLHQMEIYGQLRNEHGFTGRVFGSHPQVLELK